MKTKNNEIKIEALGFEGSSCDEATKFLRQNLGDEIALELKPTYHFTEDVEEEDKICFDPLCG